MTIYINMASKATPINQIQSQPDMGGQPQLDNIDEVLNELHQNDQQQMYAESAQQPQMMMAPQQQQMMMAPPQMPMLMPPPMMVKPASLVDRLLSELKDALIVAIVFVILNFEPVSKALDGVFTKVSTSPMVLLVLKGVCAGLIFYAVRKLVLNQ